MFWRSATARVLRGPGSGDRAGVGLPWTADLGLRLLRLLRCGRAGAGFAASAGLQDQGSFAGVRRRVADELHPAMAAVGEGTEIADERAVPVGVHHLAQGCPQPQELGGPDVDEEYAVLDAIAV